MSKRTITLIFALTIVFLVFLIFSKTASVANSKTPAISSEKPLKVPNLAELDLMSWHEFSSAAPPFKVMFPTVPQHATDKKVDPADNSERKYNMFISQKTNGTVFGITVIEFDASKNIDNGSFIEEILQQLVGAKNENVLAKKEHKKWNDRDALSFEIVQNNVIMVGSIFVENNALFIIAETAEKELFNENEFNFFTNSLDLNKRISYPSASKK